MCRKTISRLFVGIDASLKEAIRAIDDGGKQFAFCRGKTGELVGVITDGDVRRALLAGRTLEDPIRGFETADFLSAKEGESRQVMLSRMRQFEVHQLPVLNAVGDVVDLVVFDDLARPEKVLVDVVIMAGGLGSRLGVLTDECPKPMLKVGGKPILEHIVNELITQGLTRISISVNYLRDQIIDYFGDGESFGATIGYIEESQPLGTAGALSLYQPVSENVVVVNGDVITRMDFGGLIKFHETQSAECTVCVQAHRVEIPYGVFELEHHKIISIKEKPSVTQFVNAGIYVLNASVLSTLSEGQRLDMPELLQNILNNSGSINAFPLHEQWMDLGEVGQFTKAVKTFPDL